MVLTFAGISLVFIIFIILLIAILAIIQLLKLMPKGDTINIVVGILALAFCFSMSWRGAFTFENWFIDFLVSAILVTITFGVHELTHRLVADKYDAIVSYRAWPLGILIAVIISFITKGWIVFAAVGAIGIITKYQYRVGRKAGAKIITPYEMGKVAASGPLSNILAAAVAKGLLSYTGYAIFYDFMLINIFMAIFNVLPYMFLYFFPAAKIAFYSLLSKAERAKYAEPKLVEKRGFSLAALIHMRLVTSSIMKFRSEGEYILWGSRLLWFFVFTMVILSSILLFLLPAIAAILIALFTTIPLWFILVKRFWT